MENKEVFKINADTREVTIIHKNGLDEIAPISFNTIGSIESVSRYISSRFSDDKIKLFHQGVSASHSIVIVDIENGVIQLAINPSNKYTPSITGQLVLSKEIEQFKINTNKKYDRNDLLKLVRFNAYQIENSKRLIEELQKLNIKASIESKNVKDSRGNVDKSLLKTIVSEIPESFVINIPIFKGQPSLKFRVDIIMETTDASVEFWLESTELHALIAETKATIIANEIAKIDAYNILIIYK
jgi:hypothetical protein